VIVLYDRKAGRNLVSDASSGVVGCDLVENVRDDEAGWDVAVDEDVLGDGAAGGVAVVVAAAVDDDGWGLPSAHHRGVA